MNIARITQRFRILFNSIKVKNTINQNAISILYPNIIRQYTKYSKFNSTKTIPLVTTLITAGFFSFFQDEETPEQKLINTIKRSILSIERQEYDKAERMLHLALRMAQDLNNRDGITYVYDVMANLALDREQFAKAERLFVDVMKRLFADGLKEDDTKILHINSKIAHIAQLEGNTAKADQGFKYTLEKIEAKRKRDKDDKDLKELSGMTKNWYGQLLMVQNKFKEAKQNFVEAFDIYVEIYGKLNADAVNMLNNLSVACSRLGDLSGAKSYIMQATEIIEQLPDLVEAGVIKANLGLILLKEGLFEQAKEMCNLAWRLGKKFENKDAMHQAQHCIDMLSEYKGRNS